MLRPSCLAGCFLAILLLAQTSDAAETFSGKCVGVSDGDTIKVLRDGKEVRIRLEGIDCPESGQDFSAKAKRFTSSLVFGKTVSVVVSDIDRYGRLVARVIADDQDVSVALVQAGLAWHYVEYSSDPVLARAETTARAAGIGVWSLPNPRPPWEHRSGAGTGESSTPAPAVSSGTIYHGNRRSKVFHAPWCQHYTCKNCTVIFNSRDDAVRAGYRPGGNCKP